MKATTHSTGRAIMQGPEKPQSCQLSGVLESTPCRPLVIDNRKVVLAVEKGEKNGGGDWSGIPAWL